MLLDLMRGQEACNIQALLKQVVNHRLAYPDDLHHDQIQSPIVLAAQGAIEPQLLNPLYKPIVRKQSHQPCSRGTIILNGKPLCHPDHS